MVSQRPDRRDPDSGVEIRVPERGERAERRQIGDPAAAQPKRLEPVQNLDSLERTDAGEVEVEPVQRVGNRCDIS